MYKVKGPEPKKSNPIRLKNPNLKQTNINGFFFFFIFSNEMCLEFPEPVLKKIRSPIVNFILTKI